MIILVACVAVSAVLNIPAVAAERCQYGDDECLNQAVTSIFENKFSEKYGIDLMPLDPYKMDFLQVTQGNGSLFGIDIVMRNVTVYGNSKNKVKSIKGFNKERDGHFEMHIYNPRYVIVGTYEANGKILTFPIKAHGRANITLVDVQSDVIFTGEDIDKENGKFLKVKKLKATLDLSRFYMELSNLFNGNKLLEDTTNQFINDNWKEIFNEQKPSIFNSFARTIEQIMKHIFDKISYGAMFVE